MTEKARITLVGATGPVGKEFLEGFRQGKDWIDRVRGWDVDPHVGTLLEHGDQALLVTGPDPESLTPGELVILALDRESAKAIALEAVPRDALLVDCTGAFLERETVPLVVPWLNAGDLSPDHRLVAVPSPMGTLAALVLAPLMAAAGLRRVALTGLQGFAHHSRSGMDALMGQTVNLLSTGETGDSELPGQAAFNAFPVGPGSGGPWSGEAGLRASLRRVLHHPDLVIAPTLVWVPLFHGMGGAMMLEYDEPVDSRGLRDLVEAAPWLRLVDGVGTSTQDALDEDQVLVTPPVVEEADPRIASLWFTGDGLRLGLVQGVLAILQRLAERSAGKGGTA